MICPLCLRDVQELVGPERICIDCYALLEDDSDEDFDEQPFAGLYAPGLASDEIPDYIEDLIPGVVFGGVGTELDDEGWPSPPAEDGDEGAEDIPTFGGRPRF